MSLPKKYSAANAEKQWQEFWQQEGIYQFDPNHGGEIYSIDTPPPTVSGALHIGHVYSYTQAEIIARYRRMRGFNVFYPFGFDDNGLPTEKFVEKEKSVKGHAMGRAEFNQLCRETVADVEERFKNLWISLGFSADWDLTYSSIDERCQRISQRSFLDLFHKGLVDYKEEPHMWCCDTRTAIAQAELEAIEKDSFFNDVRFELKDGGEIVIGTTRPELLPSCACIFVHPEDERYRDRVGKTAIVPIFGHEVPILTDEKADMEKGTGAVMCCTFGDKTDVEWMKKHSLPIRLTITREGRLSELAQEFAGLKIAEGRKAIIEKLGETGHLLKSDPIRHTVNVYERSGKEVEYLVTPQWFIKVVEHKEDLLRLGDELTWNPPFMKQRYQHWVENLNWDWCISRQRFFGVPFPVWHCEDCQHIIPAQEESLPIDPLTSRPDTCPKCNSSNLVGDKNVMDTWATSSVTPQINAQWGEAGEREGFMPMSMRPQAHDIIRTWAFYTIVKAWYHHKTLPWKDIMISGHVLYKKGQKISKSKGNAKSGPELLVETWGADTIRYWTAGAKLGTDCYFEEQEFKIAQRLITKVFNASKFALMHLENFGQGKSADVTFSLDKGLLTQLSETVRKSTAFMEKYEYSQALAEIEAFFWSFCDNWLELAKHRLYNPDEHGDTQGKSARSALYLTLNTILKLFAPFIPHITEEIWQAHFREIETLKSVHLEAWPKAEELMEEQEDLKAYLQACKLIGAVRRSKTELRISLNSPLASVSVLSADFDAVKSVLSDLSKAAHCEDFQFVQNLPEDGRIAYEGFEVSIVPAPIEEA